MHNILFSNDCFYFGDYAKRRISGDETGIVTVACPYGQLLKIAKEMEKNGCVIGPQLMDWEHEQIGIVCNGIKYHIHDDITVKYNTHADYTKTFKTIIDKNGVRNIGNR